MLWFRRYDAFISYSHKDDAVVKPLVQLLSLNERRVFWDNNLAPGDRWDKTIQSSIKHASIFVLFWCCDTRESEYVSDEIRLALRLGKRIVPVKLCEAAMPHSLGEWQWIDLRDRIQHECAALDHRIPGRDFVALPTAKSPFKVLGAVASVAFLSLLLIGIFTLRSVRERPAEFGPVSSGPAPITAPETRTQEAEALEQRELEALRRAKQEQAAFDPERTGFKLPIGVIRLQTGKLALKPPDGEDGAIYALSESGRALDAKIIPFRLPAVPLPQLEETPIPWWYTYRALLLSMFAFIAAIIAFGTWLIRSRRRRASETLSITMDYLGRIAGQT